MEGFRVLEATILHAMINGVMNVFSSQIDMVSFGALSHAGFEDVGDAFGRDKRITHAISIDLLFLPQLVLLIMIMINRRLIEIISTRKCS